jgi:Ca-activated chloride channel homolog
MKRRGLTFALLLLLTLALGLAYPLIVRGGDLHHVRWQAPWALGGLGLVPLVLYFSTWGRTRRAPRLLMGSLQGARAVRTTWKNQLVDLPGILRGTTVALFCLALARPVSVLEAAVGEEQGIDLVVALDLSGSMEASMENLPQELQRFLGELPKGILPTRLDAAKAVLRDFISRRTSDRIGVVVFGRTAYVVSPPTLDYQLLDALVSRMELSMIDPHGTAIGDALGVAVARLRRSDAKSKVVILLTDGDNQGGTVSPEYAAHLANKVGVQIFPIQMGTGQMAKKLAGYDLFGQPRYQNVAYPTNPELLKKLASLTDGKPYIAADASELRNSLHDVLNRLEKTKFEAAHSTYTDLFPLFLLPGVLLLALEALLLATLLRRFP